MKKSIDEILNYYKRFLGSDFESAIWDMLVEMYGVGYDDGHDVGYNEGRATGYDEGYDDGVKSYEQG